MSLNRNIKNTNSLTALDALRASGSHNMNKATEINIIKAGGKTGDSLSEVETMSVFLRKPVTFREYCSTGMARYRSRMSDGARNSLLVITALIITATYQSASQPVDSDKQLDFGFFISEIVLLWGFNTTAFLLSIALTFILLPVGRAYTWWYFFITVPLICSYVISVYKKYSPSIFFYMYVIVALVFLIYMLVFYVRWKLTTQKKVPNPKTEMVSEGSKTMV
ncbi:unnamed protein product [Microthlaspi erraticum]|uniref:PGG domain-containing protein n=1 Tax=Microthlaspi erraticum TaxID=1685480 RepID=A0A6D2KBW4_9BRAS|nr:unnamed protein product [Microthlaspi erraticum]CAA7049197.1 unnamed protein product [Microthlaspi erraticum]